MKAALIGPGELLEDIQPCSSYHLILTHKVIHDVKYQEFYRKRSKAGDYIILDNSAAENGARSRPLKDVVLAAMLVKPSVVVLPDFLFDIERTLDEIINALKSPQLRFLRKVLPDIKLCAVVQGHEPSTWLDCFGVLNDVRNGIDILGIPMLTTFLFGSRSDALRKISRRVKKPCHLFGFWKNTPLDELEKEKQYDFVMGVDTSKPVRLAMHDMDLSGWLDLPRNNGSIDRPVNGVNKELLLANCNQFVELCK